MKIRNKRTAISGVQVFGNPLKTTGKPNRHLDYFA
jgi:hypothetical protein